MRRDGNCSQSECIFLHFGLQIKKSTFRGLLCLQCISRLALFPHSLAVVQKLPLEDGLILESLRALVRDIPNVLAASKICRQKNAEAQKSDPVTGGCHNVLLEDIMNDYAYAFEG